MNFRTAYTAILVQVPPVAVGVVGVVAAFLGSGLPALKLYDLGMAAQAVDNGVRWGSAASGAAAIAIGILGLLGLRFFGVDARSHRIGAGAVAAGAPVGALAVGLGAWAGPVLAGASSAEAAEVLAGCWWQVWPVVVAALAMAVAVGLSAKQAEVPPG